MNKLFHSTTVFLFWLSFIIVITPTVFAAEEMQSSIIVDFASGSVRSIKIRSEINDIKKAIGARRIKKTTEYPEGQPQDMYIIYFGKHKIFKHCSAFSYNDSVFKTKDGLGIGSKVKDFNKRYGQGQVSEEEGFSIYYKTENVQISVDTKYIFSEKQNINLYTNSVVNEIWVW